MIYPKNSNLIENILAEMDSEMKGALNQSTSQVTSQNYNNLIFDIDSKTNE